MTSPLRLSQRFSLALAASLLACGLGQRPAAAASPDAPNIIFIMADDYGWPFYSFMKDIQDSGTFPTPTQHPDFPGIPTPNLDRLADRGAVFPIGHAGSSKCGPSFRSSLTGKYPKDYLGKQGPVPGERIIPEYLSDLGYISYGFGKIWGGDFKAQGFTEGGLKSRTVPHKTVKPIFDFIDRRAPGGPPWFIWYAPSLPHYPFDAPAAYQAMFPPESYGAHDRYYANIAWFDKLVGDLLDGLSTRGLGAETLIVYQSDNGYAMINSKASNGENGFRTPILVSWPGRIPSGQLLPQMVHATDLLPTILDYGGAAMDGDGTLPASYPATVAGRTLRPFLEGGASVPGRPHLFGHKHRNQVRYLRTQDGLRLLSMDFAQTQWKLFDLKTDPDERSDLINDPAYAGRIPALKAALNAWWTP